MAEENKKPAEEKTPQAEKKNDRYVEGNYRAKTSLKVLKTLTHADKKNSDGTIARTFGTWTAPNNFYYFSDKTSTQLTAEDLKHQTIRQLIDQGTIFRVL